jgi:hypothetical protein
MSTEIPFNQKGHAWDQVNPILSHDDSLLSGGLHIPLHALNSQGQEVVSLLMVQPVMEPTLHDYFVGDAADDDEASGVRPASENLIQELEKVRIEGVDLEVCPVCLEGLSVGLEAMRMPCLHVYHEGCIVEWLRKCNLCPLCRYEMPF